MMFLIPGGPLEHIMSQNCEVCNGMGEVCVMQGTVLSAAVSDCIKLF